MTYCDKCGTLLMLNTCTNKYCNPLAESKKWIVDGAEVQFRELVTYEEAKRMGKAMARAMN